MINEFRVNLVKLNLVCLKVRILKVRIDRTEIFNRKNNVKNIEKNFILLFYI